MSRKSAPVLRAGVDPCQRNRAAGSKLVRERDGSSGVSLPGREHGFKRRGVARSTTKHGVASSGLNTCGGKWEERPVLRLRLQEHRRTKLTRNLEPTKNSVDGAAAALFHTLAEPSSPAPWNALTSAPISFFLFAEVWTAPSGRLLVPTAGFEYAVRHCTESRCSGIGAWLLRMKQLTLLCRSNRRSPPGFGGSRRADGAVLRWRAKDGYGARPTCRSLGRACSS